MERIPKPGEFYRHFKDKLYQVLAVAKHTETGEQMVVYQALYGDYGVYVRPLSLFVSEVDHEKYPDVEQKYRFQKVEFKTGQESEKDQPAKEAEEQEPEKPGHDSREPELNPLIRRFVEAETFPQRMEVLAAMKGKVRQEDLDVLYVFLDMPLRSGDVEEQLRNIERNLQMQREYDGSRLR